MKLHEIRELMEAFDGMNICRLELEDGPFAITLSKEHGVREEEPRRHRPEPAAPLSVEHSSVPEPAVSQPAEPATGRIPVTSPVVGVFYSAPTPGAEPCVRVGDRVQKGQTLCIVEAMKMMNEITAEQDGTVSEIAAKDGDLVEYGAPLLYLTK